MERMEYHYEKSPGGSTFQGNFQTVKQAGGVNFPKDCPASCVWAKLRLLLRLLLLLYLLLLLMLLVLLVLLMLLMLLLLLQRER